MSRILAGVCLLISLAAIAHAQNISGQLSGNLGPGTYTVVGNCWINAGDSLRIMPRTTLLHSGPYEWVINGRLLASGTQADSIRFIRQFPDTAYDWRGLRFNASSASGSLLEYCLIDHCNNSTRYGGGIYCSGAAITLRHSTVSWSKANLGGGIYAANSAIIIEDCLVSHNSSVELITTSGNGGGLFLLSSNNAYIRRSEFAWNHNSGA
ncbi:MAG TPA: hypothetical protein VF398_08555 [bacterium]|jgi:hypothetical protein